MHLEPELGLVGVALVAEADSVVVLEVVSEVASIADSVVHLCRFYSYFKLYFHYIMFLSSSDNGFGGGGASFTSTSVSTKTVNGRTVTTKK